MPGHGGHHGGHGGHGGHHGGGGFHRGWGRGVGPWYGGSPDVFVVDEESELDRELKRLKILEQMKKLAAPGGQPLKGFDMPSTTTLLVGAAAIGVVYLLLRKKR